MNSAARKIIKDFRRKHNGKSVELQYTGCHSEDREMIYKHADGTRITIPPTEVGLLNQLRNIPAKYLIPLLGLDDEFVLQFIAETRKSENEKLISLLKMEWHDRYCGEPFDVNDLEFPGLDLTGADILKKSTSKRPLPLSLIRKAIAYLESGREIYIKEKEATND